MREILVCRALRNEGCVFKEIEGVLGKNIEEVIPEFFVQRECGVHVLILCTDKEISSDEFLSLMQRREENQGRKVVKLGPEDNRSYCQCAVYSLAVSNAILNIYDYVLSVIENSDLKKFCSIESLSTILGVAPQGMAFDSAFKMKFRKDTGEKLSEPWLTPDQNDEIAELRLLIVLNSEEFDYFISREGYFASILEYVILEADSHALICKLRDKKTELENELKQAECENEDLRTRLKKAVEDKDNEVSELKDKLAQSKKTIQELKEELSRSQKQVDELTKCQKISEIYGQIEDLEKNSLIGNGYNKNVGNIEYIIGNDKMILILEKPQSIEDEKFEKRINKRDAYSKYASIETVRKDKDKRQDIADKSEESALEIKKQVKAKNKDELLDKKSTVVPKKEDNVLSDITEEDKER